MIVEKMPLTKLLIAEPSEFPSPEALAHSIAVSGGVIPLAWKDGLIFSANEKCLCKGANEEITRLRLTGVVVVEHVKFAPMPTYATVVRTDGVEFPVLRDMDALDTEVVDWLLK